MTLNVGIVKTIVKDIVTLKYKENISLADARKRLQPIFYPSKNSYASVTKTPQFARPLQPWASNIRPPTDFQKWGSIFLIYIKSLLDAIGNKKIFMYTILCMKLP